MTRIVLALSLVITVAGGGCRSGAAPHRSRTPASPAADSGAATPRPAVATGSTRSAGSGGDVDDVEDRERFERDYADRLTVVDARMEDLRRWAKAAPEDRRESIVAALDVAADKRKVAGKRLDDLVEASDSRWPVMRILVVRALVDLDSAFDAAEARLRGKGEK